MKLRATAAISGVVLASCAHGMNPSAALPPAAVRGAPAPAAAYRTLYSFTGYPSGAAPAALAPLGGALYGTTADGGAHTFGSVYRRDSSGLHFLYSFKGGTDGSSPEGPLLPLGGKLYGMTQYGGASGDGTVFAIGAAGAESVVYAFKGGTDGATPILGGLVAVNGALYGVTSAGGDSKCHVNDGVGCGVAFTLAPSGQERVLYRFRGKPDGASPIGSLVQVGSALYGTTEFGGRYGDGSVYAITTAGVESNVYSFKGYPDGAGPYAGMTQQNGSLYGTTAYGGRFDDAGTVYTVSTTGTEAVLHSFQGYPDGAIPYGGLTYVDGTFYGTTQFGGAATKACTGRGEVGCGVVFSVTPAGDESVLYRFKGPPDGANPWTNLVAERGWLYGTTVAGGSKSAGSIFEIQVPGARTR